MPTDSRGVNSNGSETHAKCFRSPSRISNSSTGRNVSQCSFSRLWKPKYRHLSICHNDGPITTQQTMRIPKPRFTVRQLVVLTALVCLYLSMWRQTKLQGYRDFEEAFGRPCHGSPLPFVLVSLKEFDPYEGFELPAEVMKGAGISRGQPIVNTYRCYLWMFSRPYRTSITYERPRQTTPGLTITSRTITTEEPEPTLGTTVTLPQFQNPPVIRFRFDASESGRCSK